MAQTQVNLMFRAFSDPTRLRILHLLLDGELCVGDLVKILKVPQPTASRHLAYLRRTGLVATRRNGLWNYYALQPAANEFHRNLLKCLRGCFDAVPAIGKDCSRAKSVKRAGGCCPV